ncbi:MULTISPECIES: Uma2 family endonuclease [unclassified Streptomyces]|uniref:Uma2 family endonuclease n=1 Tax=unclassified Streptomyces TaxID=2593676 RepID=UPI0033D6DA04
MSALTVGHEPGQDWEALLRFREEMTWPEGSKVEIIEGVITVSPSPSNNHNEIAELIHRQLGAIPFELGIYHEQSLLVPSREGAYIPDLVVAPRREVVGKGEQNIPAAAAELVLEVTSQSNAGHDRIGKAAGYAAGGVPLYLLADRWAPGGPTVTLYGQPQNRVYRVLSACKFGEPITLPEPFSLEIDTSAFPVD